MTPRTTAPPPAGPWDRLAIRAPVTADCALSYDASQQTAVALHLRGPLRYLFPLLIDGSIGCGAPALDALPRKARRERLYAWPLCSAATVLSVLLAVRLTQQPNGEGGPRLNGLGAAALSARPPLALADSALLLVLLTARSGNPGPGAGPDDTGAAMAKGGQ
ncbi:hypothetical protein ACWF94_17535 [Streptomyces sp. NPDC055078]